MRRKDAPPHRDLIPSLLLFPFLLPSLELRDTQVYEPWLRFVSARARSKARATLQSVPGVGGVGVGDFGGWELMFWG